MCLRQRIDRVTYWWEDSTDGGGARPESRDPEQLETHGILGGRYWPLQVKHPLSNSCPFGRYFGQNPLRCSGARVFVRVDHIAYILIPRYSFWSTQLKYLTFPPSNVLCSSWSNVMICGNSNFSQNSQKIQRKCELKNIKVEHLLMLFKSRISSLSKKRKNKSCPDWPGAFPAQLVATLASRFSSASVLLR